MIGRVVVMEPEDYQTWLAGGPAGRVAGGGGREAVHRAQLHHLPPAPTPPAAGPCCSGLFGRAVKLASGDSVVADEAYVRESIVNPAAKVVGRATSRSCRRSRGR